MKGRGIALHVAALAAAVAVCGSARAETPAGNDAQFYMLLAYKPAATMGDAWQAVTMLVNGDSRLLPVEECRKLLVDRKVARASWGEDASALCTKGRLAYMVCQALGIKGGVTMRLLGPSERYCLFECRYLELMASGATYQNCTGGELVSVIDRADTYRREKQQPSKDTEAAPAETGEKAAEASTPTAAPAATVQPSSAPASEPAAKAAVDKGEPPERVDAKAAPATEPKAKEVAVPVGP